MYIDKNKNKRYSTRDMKSILKKHGFKWILNSDNTPNYREMLMNLCVTLNEMGDE